MTLIWQEIQRPTLLINKTQAQANIARMRAKAEHAQVQLRPHFKTHQSVEVGRWFGEPAEIPIAVSNTDMAWQFAKAGWRDIFLAIPINPREIDTLNELAASVRLTLVIDHEDAFQTLRLLQYPCRVFVEIDTGYGRTGMPWFEPKRLRAMLTRLQMQAFLTDLGLMVHNGQTYQAQSPAEVATAHEDSTKKLLRLISMLDWKGRRLNVSVGDTPTCSLMDEFPGATEIRPGNYVFYDMQQYQIGACSWDQIAFAVACPVIARYPERGEVVVHGGAVHFSKDSFTIEQCPRASEGVQSICPQAIGSPASHVAAHCTVYGQVAERTATGWGQPIEGGYLVGLSQEHGRVALPPELVRTIKVGDMLPIIPAHSCLAQATGTPVKIFSGN